MSQLLYKYFLKKTNLDSLVAMGPTSDPYFEEIPENDLHFYQRKGAKRRRKLPGFIPKHDLKVLESVKRKAYRLDLQLSLCGLRIGWAGIIGLIPWIGDFIAMMFAMQLLRKADQIEGGLPPLLRRKMQSNIVMDFGIGLIPLVGDFINVLYKCNLRNFVLLEQHLVHKYEKLAAVTTKPLTKHDARPEVMV
ncbi:CIC11C00000000880 [Sungouiella intermedia]|uniref:CIC11C00000000880 n=1 Tax=Sungouiella intermedia TaxID=45354 RepID=A0A1L0B6S8_9ASCO|nr:CIC11C00000000880 [[Candida] intermedia]